MADGDNNGATAATAAAVVGGSAKEPQPRKHRKLNRSQHQLKRNAACIPCRRRRIKCDAGKPHCSSCTRSFQFLQRTNPDPERDCLGVQCFYEEDDDEGEPSGSGSGSVMGSGSGHDRLDDPKVTVKKLEARVEELQKALLETPSVEPSRPALRTESRGWADQPGPQASLSMAPTSTHSSHSGPLETLPFIEGQTYPSQMPVPSSSMNPDPGFIDLQPSVSEPPMQDAFMQDMQPGLLGDGQQMSGIDGEAGKVGGPFVDLIWPGWPPRLPTPAMLDHLVQVFFNMVPSISRLIHRQTFQSRLLLRPTHVDFPHSALLHAICAVAARYSAAVKTCSVEDCISRADAKLWEQKRPGPGGLGLEDSIGMEDCFAERNMRYAQLECRLEATNGRKLVDLVQAMALVCYYCQQSANWINGWMTIAQAVRAAIPLGLMRNDPGPTMTRTLKPGHSLLPPPVGAWDREERRTLMFTVLMCDINASASSGWPNMMMTDELYTRLPCSRTEFERGGEMTENPQTVRSPDLFTYHPVEDSFVALIKGGVLLNRVNKFVRFVKASDASERPFMKASHEFQQLDDDIKAFIQYFPPSLRDPLKPLTGLHKGIDADLISAHLLPHVAAIFLHEPFADLTDPSCTSAIRLSTESRACLSTIHLVTSTSLDLSYTLVPITSCDYCFSAARTLLLFYQRALELREMGSAKVLLSELEIFKLAFKALGNRFAMGVRHWGMLQAMLDRIHRENGFETPPAPLTQLVPAEPNMRARAFVAEHPDSVLTATKQGFEPLRDVMDRRRGFVPKSASLHSLSPSRPSTGSLSDPTGHVENQGQGVFSSSPLKQHMPVPPLQAGRDVFPTHPNAAVPLSDDHAFDSASFNQANFNFTSGQNGWNGLGNVDNAIIDPMGTGPGPGAIPPLPPFNDDPNVAPAPPPSGDMGFDWINWLSTANVTMMAPDEPGMGPM